MSDANDPGCPPWPKNKQSKDERIAELEAEVEQHIVAREQLEQVAELTAERHKAEIERLRTLLSNAIAGQDSPDPRMFDTAMERIGAYVRTIVIEESNDV